jgi:hypothetical protein
MWIGAARAASIPAMPMPEAREDGIRHRWLAKPVRESRLLDGMEDAATWSHHGLGTMNLSSERVREGKTALLLESPTKGEKVGGADGRPWGTAIVQRDVPGEAGGATALIQLPVQPGKYRVFVYVRDGHGGAATANAPILARKE